MPQMAPISWLILFFIFSFTLIMFNILNYFSVLPKSPLNGDKNKKFSNNISLNWKW